MLNEEKIKLMTKLALYEQKNGKEDLQLSKYYKSDYLTLKMINSAITMTIGFAILLAVIVFINAEKLLADLVKVDIVALGIKIAVLYVVFFILNMFATYCICTYRFKRSRHKLKEYDENLKELYTICKRENINDDSSFFSEHFDVENIDSAQNDISELGGISDDETIGY